MSRLAIIYCGAHAGLCQRIAELIAAKYEGKKQKS